MDGRGARLSSENPRLLGAQIFIAIDNCYHLNFRKRVLNVLMMKIWRKLEVGEARYSVGLPYVRMGIYIVSENFENFVLGMAIYIVFYKGFYAFYVYWSVFGGWAYILFLSHFKKFAKRTTIYIDTYGSPTLYRGSLKLNSLRVSICQFLQKNDTFFSSA